MSPLGSFPLGGGPLGGRPGPVAGAPGNLTLRIGPLTDGTKYLFYRSWRIREQLNGRNSCSFKLLASDGYLPILGQEVVLAIGATRIFAGKVFRRQTGFLSEAESTWLVHDLDCVDYNAICDRRRIGEVYPPGLTLGQIVRDVVTKTIGQEGITDEGVEEGPTLDRVVFPNILVSEAFDLLSQQTGYYWDVDYMRRLHFFSRFTSQAPFAIVNGDNAVFRNFFDVETLEQYRNSQYVDGGQAVMLPQREELPSDGKTRTYTVGGPIAKKPRLDLNGVEIDPNTVGIRGLEEGKAYYWAQGENTITRDQALEPLPANQPLGVTAQWFFDLDVVVTNFEGVAERKAAEGGTGLYENIATEQSLDGEEVITAKGLALLNRYGLSKEKEFELDVAGLSPGQQVSVTVPEVGANEQLHLITEMETSNLVLSERRFVVRCSTGELKGTFTEFWKRVFARNPVRINPDADVQAILPIYDRMGLADELTVGLFDYVPAEWGTAVMGEDEFE